MTSRVLLLGLMLAFAGVAGASAARAFPVLEGGSTAPIRDGGRRSPVRRPEKR